MKKKTPKRRNMVAYTMLLRYASGRGAGAHGKQGYSRKTKHKGKARNEEAN
jgi:hypothetical protein